LHKKFISHDYDQSHVSKKELIFFICHPTNVFPKNTNNVSYLINTYILITKIKFMYHIYIYIYICTHTYVYVKNLHLCPIRVCKFTARMIETRCSEVKVHILHTQCPIYDIRRVCRTRFEIGTISDPHLALNMALKKGYGSPRKLALSFVLAM